MKRGTVKNKAVKAAPKDKAVNKKLQEMEDAVRNPKPKPVTITSDEVQSLLAKKNVYTDEAGAFPVSFVCIVNAADAHEHLEGMIATLPNNAEICLLFNEAGKEESLTPVNVNTNGGHVVRSAKWVYPHGEFSFATARNIASTLATHKWVFHIDADERLSEFQHHGIAKATELFGKGVAGILVGQASLSLVREALGLDDEHMGDYINVRTLRMYRNDLGFQWLGRCHEQIVHSIKDSGYTVRASTITLIHNGYSTSAKSISDKLKRNTALLCRTCSDLGFEHPHVAYFYACLRRELNSLAEMEKSWLPVEV